MTQRETGSWRRWTALVALLGVLGCQQAAESEDAPEAPVSLDSEAAQASYTLGYFATTQFTARLGDEADNEAYLTGARDALGGADRRVAEQQGIAAVNALGARRQQADAASNEAAGSAFLEQNGAREGVVTTASGLQYEVLTDAEGPKPGPTDTVTTHYHGTLIDGTVFDSSVERGEPASFPLDRVISGWTEALQLMSVGSKYRLYVPPELAYGPRATGRIGPNSTLVFEVELLDIEE